MYVNGEYIGFQVSPSGTPERDMFNDDCVTCGAQWKVNAQGSGTLVHRWRDCGNERIRIRRAIANAQADALMRRKQGRWYE